MAFPAGSAKPKEPSSEAESEYILVQISFDELDLATTPSAPTSIQGVTEPDSSATGSGTRVSITYLTTLSTSIYTQVQDSRFNVPLTRYLLITFWTWLREHLTRRLLVPLLLSAASSLGLSHWSTNTSGTGAAVHSDFSTLTNICDYRMDYLLNQTVVWSTLSVQATKAETVIADLIMEVSRSNFPNRGVFESDLECLRPSVEVIAEYLPEFESKVTTVFSDMMEMFEDAAYIIEQSLEPSQYSFLWPSKVSQQIAIKFEGALQTSSKGLREVYHIAREMNQKSKQAKEGIMRIRQKLARESSTLEDEKASSSSLWVALGFHNPFLEKNWKSRDMLDDTERYLSDLYELTSSVLSTLESLIGDIDELRNKSEAVKLKHKVSLQDQLRSIQQTLSRFRISIVN
ncbi:hypothetical protein GYMLUDRAFT_49187 [Collybiopsis luxurians FD-317 M1]|uniref:Uncharacterized protein n=1 Tax=Collybiopsis luxurians FD-317 M1 TaxID=944289 RepID=A0A0D0BVQ5_9AGAR|nr:hypothetical protein GYMLUDRAFT_49187 [Collybiopsis luxurians FD-317 M1]